MDALLNDIRYAVRKLLKNPGFTTVAVLTLALGIGANTALFSVVDGVLLEPLPYPEPDRIVALWELDERGVATHVTAPNALDWRERSRSFEALAVHPSYEFGGRSTVLGGEEPTRAWVAPVSEGFFRALGVGPVIGRTFTAEEYAAPDARVVVVSHRFWREQLGADPDPSDRTVEVYGSVRQVVGVMPAGFRYPKETDVWGPAALQALAAASSRTGHNWAAVGRLRHGVSIDAAMSELNRITESIRAEHDGWMTAVGVQVEAMHAEIVGPLGRTIWLLLGAATLVLLVACTNVASTLLARGESRRHEMAVRRSLGASRPRLLRQLLTESLALSAAGAAVGVGAAFWLVRAVGAMAPELPRFERVAIDGDVLAFATVTAVLAAVLFGLAPALRTAGERAGRALRIGGRGAIERHRRGPWGALVAGEVATALVLLVGSGLLLHSVWRVLAVDPGFEAENVLTVDISLPEGRYADDAAIARYHERMIDAVGRVPGVERVGITNHLPLSGLWYNGGFVIEGEPGVQPSVDYRVASAGYFDALGIELLRGRIFDPTMDRAGAPDAVVINRAMAERHWPGENPVGRRIHSLANDAGTYGDRRLTVVGVVENVRQRTLTTEPRPAVYVHDLQRPARASSGFAVVRTSRPPESLIGPVRGAVRSLDPDVPVELETMASRVADSMAERRFATFVLALFAAVALALAAVGIYGVVSYSVARRDREIGIRIAMGAEPRAVVRLVLGGAMAPVLAGAGVGLLAAFGLSRFLRSLLWEVQPTDPAVYALVSLALAAVGLAAAWVPAGRVARIEPMRVLRNE